MAKKFFGEKLKLGLKKGQQSLLSRLGRVEISVDEEFDRYKREFDKERDQVMEVHKTLDSLRSHFSNCGRQLEMFCSTLLKSYGDDPLSEHLKKVESVAQQFQKENIQPYTVSLQKNCMKKLSDFHKRFDGVKEPLMKRENSKIKFDSRTAEVKRLQAKPSKDPTKLPKKKQELRQASLEYNGAAIKAKESLVNVLDTIPTTYDPIVHHVCLSTVNLCNNMAVAFSMMSDLAQNIQVDEPKQRDHGRKVSAPVHGSEKLDYGGGGGEQQQQVSYQQQLAMDSKMEDENSSGMMDMEDSVPSSSDMGLVPALRMQMEEYMKSEWYYLNDDVQQTGPYDFGQMMEMFKTGAINGDTHVFGANLPNWATIDDVDGMREIMES